MAVSTARLSKTKAIANVVGVLMILTGLTLAILGFVSEHAVQRTWLVGTGCFILLVGVAEMVLTGLLLKIESNTFRTYNQQLDAHELVQEQTDLLGKLVDNSLLSDAARSLANRDRECEAVRAAIRSDVRSERWDAALSLCDEMIDRFGYAEEAEGLRVEVNEARVDAMRRKLSEATALVEQHLDAFAWEKAANEIDRLGRALPDEPRINRLRRLYEERQAARKKQLMDEWNQAVARNDVDTAIKVLQDLDNYLTREEARSLEESARGVFKAKLLQLGMQFQFAVNEQRWRDAIEVGLQIMDEFPNARMSREVANAMEGLRNRAGLGDVEITAGQQARSS